MKLFLCMLTLTTVSQANVSGKQKVVLMENERITGGQEATPHQFPWQAGLSLKGNDGRGTFCGGSLISLNYILTAAHCVDGVKSVEVILGAQKIREREESQVRINSTEFTIHENWSGSKGFLIQDDIALIKLPQSVVLNDNIKLIKIVSHSDENNNFRGRTARVSGWGLDSDNATTISPVLRYVDAEVIGNLRCTITYPLMIRSSHICLTGNGGKSSCNGDSGGPLTTEINGEVRQIGLVSFGRADGCERGHPHVYTRLTSYQGWLEQHSDVKID